jgi:hypothetical protein
MIDQSTLKIANVVIVFSTVALMLQKVLLANNFIYHMKSNKISYNKIEAVVIKSDNARVYCLTFIRLFNYTGKKGILSAS